MHIQKTHVGFRVGASRVAGVLYLPDSALRSPCVVLANGFSGTMDWIVPRFAERFAAAGVAALAFDYRHLGESEGAPRQLVDLEEQRADLRAAIGFVRAHPAIDPGHIALWGTSLGGSHAVTVAAEDPSIAALVLNAPALDALAGANIEAKRRSLGVSSTMVITTTMRLLAAALDDAVRGALHLPPRYLAVYGKPGKAFFTDPALAENFARLEAASTSWQNRIAARFLLHAPRYRRGTIKRISAPILVCLAEHDVEVSAAFVTSKLTEAKAGRVRIYPVGHFDLYHGDTFNAVVADQVAFLREHLTSESGSAATDHS